MTYRILKGFFFTIMILSYSDVIENILISIRPNVLSRFQAHRTCEISLNPKLGLNKFSELA